MTTLRDRILAAAVDRTTSDGWASVTMARLADDVGVSRQTIYNEVGGKEALAEAMVLDELAQFLAVVEAQFDRHPADPVSGVADAAAAVLTRAVDHPLLRAIVSTDTGAPSDLLPLLTTESGSVVAASIDVVARRLRGYPGLTARARAVTADTVVRVVLSHVTQASINVERVTADLRWLATRLLG